MAKKILVVDDEINLLKLVESRLKATGYEVITARDGKEGLEKAKTEKPDLILLDIIMPGMDGREALKKLKLNEDTKSIPVVMLTVKGEPEEIVDSLVYSGAVDYIVKPYTADVFLRKINNALQVEKELPDTLQSLLNTIEKKVKKTLEENKEK